MCFWETDELSIKALFANGWNIFLKDALGFKILLLILVPDLISFWLGLFNIILSFFELLFYCLLVPYMIYQTLIGKEIFLSMILTFFKEFWSRSLFFSIVTLVMHGGILLSLQLIVDYLASKCVPDIHVALISNVFRVMTMPVILVPFFFMAFSIAIKNMEVLKAFSYSIILVRRHWKRVLLIETLFVPPLLLPIFVPVLSFYIGEVIAVYLFMVLIIQFCNLDYLENRP